MPIKKKRNTGPIILVAATLMAFLLAFPVYSAAAQEEDSGAVTVTAGPHLVRVVPVNTNLAAGFIQLALYVTDANTGEIVPHATVIVKADNEGENYEGWAYALNSPADPGKYDLRLNLGSTGDWVINVDVTSPLGQGGGSAMTFTVPSVNRYTQGSLVFFGVFAVMMLGVAYLFWSVKRQNRRRREAAQSVSQE
ncbi:MAG: hypothetical protein O3A93_08885 [Chloroflexi bacterium]|nr:hypothetical protein [Chloroflexota bacterium]MDA1271361.1 hypothetical protein [Chloroflexota bacterium]